MSDCWLFAGQINTYGYGVTYHEMAHRLMYVAYKGAIPDDLPLDHLCRVRRCVNPEHLEAVSQRTNLLRGKTVAAKHAQKTHCPYGHPFSGSNLRVSPTRPNTRVCRTCDNASKLRRYHRIKRKVIT